MHPALHRAFEFLIHHGLAVLFGWVLVEQLGVPIPAMPLLLAAGVRMRFRRFLLFDAIGSMLWAGVFLAIGYVFAGQIERVAAQLASLGGWLLVLFAGALGTYIAYKFVARQRFLRELRIARITVDELKEKIDAGEQVTIVDLRHSLDFEAEPETIRGALHIEAKELEEKK